MKDLLNTKYLKKFTNWFDKEKRKIFLITFILGFIANILVIKNDLIYTDSLSLTEVYVGGVWDLSLGRWFLKYIGLTRFGLASSVVSSVLSLISLSLSTVLLIDLFKIKSKISQILISILLVVSPFFTETLLSVYCSFEFTMAFTLSVLSVYLLYKFDKGYYLGIITLALSLGLYQAYLGVTAGLCILVPIVLLLKEKENTKKIKDKIIKSILMGIFGIIIYEIILHLLLLISNTQMSSYSGANEIGLNTLLKIPLLILEPLKSFYNYFITNNIINNIFYKRNIINIILIIISILIIINLYKNNKERKNKTFTLTLLTLIILIPFSLGIIELIIEKRDINSLMCAPYILIYIFIFALIDDLNIKKLYEKTLCIITLLLMIYISESYFVMANASYMATRITKERTTFAATKIVSDIYESGIYEKENKVLFIGTATGEYFENTNKVYNLASGLTPNTPLMWEEPDLCNRGWHNFIEYYLGQKLERATLEDYNNIITTNEYKNMDTYPNKNYIKKINGIVVVKIKEKKQ